MNLRLGDGMDGKANCTYIEFVVLCRGRIGLLSISIDTVLRVVLVEVKVKVKVKLLLVLFLLLHTAKEVRGFVLLAKVCGWRRSG